MLTPVPGTASLGESSICRASGLSARHECTTNTPKLGKAGENAIGDILLSLKGFHRAYSLFLYVIQYDVHEIPISLSASHMI